MEPFLFFRLRFRPAYDSTCDSDFRFSLGLERSYDYDSDSIASENQPSVAGSYPGCQATSFPASLLFPHPGAPGDGKRRDPGNEVGCQAARNLWHPGCRLLDAIPRDSEVTGRIPAHIKYPKVSPVIPQTSQPAGRLGSRAVPLYAVPVSRNGSQNFAWEPKKSYFQ